MDIKEIRKLSDAELVAKIKETKEELFTKRMQQANGTLEKPVELRTLRRNVAKMKTVLTERKLDGGNK
ncbi:MAG: 50S ribosomal protein L29 [Bacilli bacterium]|nr:50S ribosomal protein L29 [Bacilli bacterium]MBQ8901798.1 50S ribosomal protein L29 [Bacilli bacterium]